MKKRFIKTLKTNLEKDQLDLPHHKTIKIKNKSFDGIILKHENITEIKVIKASSVEVGVVGNQHILDKIKQKMSNKVLNLIKITNPNLINQSDAILLDSIKNKDINWTQSLHSNAIIQNIHESLQNDIKSQLNYPSDFSKKELKEFIKIIKTNAEFWLETEELFILHGQAHIEKQINLIDNEVAKETAFRIWEKSWCSFLSLMWSDSDNIIQKLCIDAMVAQYFCQQNNANEIVMPSNLVHGLYSDEWSHQNETGELGTNLELLDIKDVIQ